MKMRLFAVVFVAMAAFQGCTYEEGPDLSLRSKVGRLTGRWNNTFLEGGAAPKAGDSVIYEFTKDNKGKATTKTKLFNGSFNVATIENIVQANLEWRGSWYQSVSHREIDQYRNVVGKSF
jgi:hypothetical protein